MHNVATVAVAGGLASVCVALSVGCASHPPSELCMEIDDPDSVWRSGQVVRIAAFGAGARCDGTTVASGGPAPIATHDSPSAGPLIVDAPDAVSAIAVTLFADEGAQRSIATACAEASASSAPSAESQCVALRVLRCHTEHSNGLGQTFEDCEPLGTYNAAQATAACARFTGDATRCAQTTCSDGSAAVCGSGTGVLCGCWIHDGDNAGRVRVSSGGSCKCSGSSQRWN